MKHISIKHTDIAIFSCLFATILLSSSCSDDDKCWYSTVFNISGSIVQLQYEIPFMPHSTVYCMTKGKIPNNPIDIYMDSVLKITIDKGHCNKSFEIDHNPLTIRAISDDDTVYSVFVIAPLAKSPDVMIDGSPCIHGVQLDFVGGTYEHKGLDTLFVSKDVRMQYQADSFLNSSAMMATLNDKVVIPCQKTPFSGVYCFSNDACGTYLLKLNFNDGNEEKFVLVIRESEE